MRRVSVALLAVCLWLLPKGFWIGEDARPWTVLLRWLAANPA